MIFFKSFTPEVTAEKCTQVAPAPLVKGANYEVTDPVPIERFLVRAELHSPYGTFRVSGWRHPKHAGRAFWPVRRLQ